MAHLVMFDRMRMTMMKVKPVNPTTKCERLNVLNFDWVSIKWHFFGNENIIKKIPLSMFLCLDRCMLDAWNGACYVLSLFYARCFLFYSMLSSRLTSTRYFLYFLPDAIIGSDLTSYDQFFPPKIISLNIFQ